MKEAGISQRDLDIIMHLVSTSQLCKNDESTTEEVLENYDDVELTSQALKSAKCPNCGSYVLESEEEKEDGTVNFLSREPCKCGEGCRFVISTVTDEITRYKCCSCS